MESIKMVQWKSGWNGRQQKRKTTHATNSWTIPTFNIIIWENFLQIRENLYLSIERANHEDIRKIDLEWSTVKQIPVNSKTYLKKKKFFRTFRTKEKKILTWAIKLHWQKTSQKQHAKHNTNGTAFLGIHETKMWTKDVFNYSRTLLQVSQRQKTIWICKRQGNTLFTKSFWKIYGRNGFI